MSELLNKLKRPFPAKAISWRVGATNAEKTQGIALAYIDARDVMHRLDEVFGMDWQCRYSHADKKTICEIGVKVDGEWAWRSNGAGDSDVEAEKGAISDAFKRAAVMFGVGRYLYSLPNAWVPIKAQGKSYALVSPPSLPKWATPEGFDEAVGKKERAGVGAILPTDGAADALTQEGVNRVTDLATTVRDYMTESRVEDAAAVIDMADLSPEEYIVLWKLLDSAMRSAITSCQDIGRCTTLDALKKVWEATPKHAHAALLQMKEKKKLELVENA